jgi:hypothetical protein
MNWFHNAMTNSRTLNIFRSSFPHGISQEALDAADKVYGCMLKDRKNFSGASSLRMVAIAAYLQQVATLECLEAGETLSPSASILRSDSPSSAANPYLERSQSHAPHITSPDRRGIYPCLQPHLVRLHDTPFHEHIASALTPVLWKCKGYIKV